MSSYVLVTGGHMKDLLTLDDIARELRVSRKTVQRLAKSGKLPAITISRRGGFTYAVPMQNYFDWKREWVKKKEEKNCLSDRDFLLKEKENWLEWCKNGLLTGKPLSETTISIYDYFFDYYLSLLPRRYKKTPLVSIDNIRLVFGKINIQSFSIKKNIYDAIRSFTKYLITKRIISPELLNQLPTIRPKRLFPPRKPHCTNNEFEKLFEEASKRHLGQSPYDVILNSTTIATIVFSGLRASELCNLRLQDIDLVNRKLFVYLGKGKKNRSIGICNRLYDYLVKYLEARPKSDNNNLFLTISNLTGEPVPLTRGVLLQKVKRLSKRVGLDINLHGLRRTFATIAANAGKPINIISLALGHADLKTTQGYLMTTQDEVIKEMQGW